MQITPLSENPWYQKILKEITETDKKKREMESNFHSSMIDDYQSLVEEEAKEAVELLKYGVKCRVDKGSVLLTVDDDTTFEIQKEALRNELGVEQYNLLVNNVTEEPQAPAVQETVQVTDDKPQSASSQFDANSLVKMPDGTKVPGFLAPMLIFQQAMNQAVSVYTGVPSDYPVPGTGLAVPNGKKEHSKTTSELLKNLADLQQQVLLIEDEKEEAKRGNTKEIEDLKIAKAEEEAKQKETLAKINELQEKIADINQRYEQKLIAAKQDIQRATEAARAKEEEIAQLKAAIGEKDGLAEQTQESLDAKEKALKEASDELTARKSELDALKKSFEDVKASSEEEKAKMQEEADALKKEIEASAARARSEAFAKADKSKAAEIETLSNKHSSEVASLKTAHLKEIEDINSRHSKEVEELKRSVVDLKNSHAQELEALKKDQKSKLDEARAEGARDSDELKDLRQKYEDAENSLEKEKANSKKAWDKSNKLSDDIAKLRKDLDEANRRADEAAEQSDNLRDQLDALMEVAYNDSLTGVKNTDAMNNDLSRKDPASLVVVRVSINGLKVINESGGIPLGNQTIQATASALADKFGKDNVYRTMGDQFIVLTSNLDKANGLAADVRNSLKAKNNVSIVYGIAKQGTNGASTCADIFMAALQIMQNMKSGSVPTPAPASAPAPSYEGTETSINDISVDETPAPAPQPAEADDADEFSDDDALMKTLAMGESL